MYIYNISHYRVTIMYVYCMCVQYNRLYSKQKFLEQYLFLYLRMYYYNLCSRASSSLKSFDSLRKIPK